MMLWWFMLCVLRNVGVVLFMVGILVCLKWFVLMLCLIILLISCSCGRLCVVYLFFSWLLCSMVMWLVIVYVCFRKCVMNSMVMLCVLSVWMVVNSLVILLLFRFEVGLFRIRMWVLVESVCVIVIIC